VNDFAHILNMEHNMLNNEIKNEIKKMFFKHTIAVNEFINPLKEVLKNKPNDALEYIVDTYDAALNSAYGKDRSFVCAVAGGPCEIIPSALYNVIGTFYPFFDRDTKDKAIRKIISILDKINYTYVQNNHTSFIREPLLLSDICIIRPFYWPGFSEFTSIKNKLEKDNDYSFDKFQYFYMKNGLFEQEVIEEGVLGRTNTVRSDFLVAVGLLYKDCEFREDYVTAANPEFLDRVVKGICGLFLGNSLDDNKSIKELEEFLPKSLHYKIQKNIIEKGWLNLEKFGYFKPN